MFYVDDPGLPRGAFENKDVTFQHHIQSEHNVWNYLYFIVHLLTKDTTQFTGPESYVYDKILPYIQVSSNRNGTGGRRGGVIGLLVFSGVSLMFGRNTWCVQFKE